MIRVIMIMKMIKVIMFTMPVLKWKSRPQEERVLFTIAVMAGLMQAITIMMKMIEMMRVHDGDNSDHFVCSMTTYPMTTCECPPCDNL